MDEDRSASTGQRWWGWIKEFLIVILAALVLSFILKTFFIQSFWIPSSSMEDTLEQGDRILVSKWRPGVFDVRAGDMVVFKDPGGWLNIPEPPEPEGLAKVADTVLTFTGLLPEDSGEHLVKRIVGLPGDVVECPEPDSAVMVNGVEVTEVYLKDGVQPCGREFTHTVPEGYLWVMGDNRDNSADSREHQGQPGGGAIPITNVVGTVFVTVWPSEHWEIHGNPFEDPAEGN